MQKQDIQVTNARVKFAKMVLARAKELIRTTKVACTNADHLIKMSNDVEQLSVTDMIKICRDHYIPISELGLEELEIRRGSGDPTSAEEGNGGQVLDFSKYH